MPRVCTVCRHDEVHAINVALVHREAYRNIANRYGLSLAALKRHSQDHLPELLVKASRAQEVADADQLLGDIARIRQMKLGDEWAYLEDKRFYNRQRWRVHHERLARVHADLAEQHRLKAAELA